MLLLWHLLKYAYTFSLDSAAHVLVNRYIAFDCKPDMMAFSEEKFFSIRSSCAMSIHVATIIALSCGMDICDEKKDK